MELLMYRKQHGCLWWLLIGWWLWYITWPFIILSFLLFPSKKTKQLERNYVSLAKRKREIEASGITETDGMNGYDFEYWCATLLRKNGFSKINITPKSGDQGVDITAYMDETKYAVQCKCYKNKLGNKPVQEVVAGRAYYNCDIAVVMTNNYFTQAAYDLAGKNGVILWDRDILIEMSTRSSDVKAYSDIKGYKSNIRVQTVLPSDPGPSVPAGQHIGRPRYSRRPYRRAYPRRGGPRR